MAWAAKPTGKRGCQPIYSDAAVQTCLTMKVLFGMALRQTTGFVESLLGLIGLDWDVPDFSTLSRRQKSLVVNIPHRGSQGQLHFLIDSTGIKVQGEGSGTPASMAVQNAASGARSISGSTNKRWKSGRSKLPATTSAMRPCCPNYWPSLIDRKGLLPAVRRN